jgi:hypothetical protein
MMVVRIRSPVAHHLGPGATAAYSLELTPYSLESTTAAWLVRQPHAQDSHHERGLAQYSLCTEDLGRSHSKRRESGLPTLAVLPRLTGSSP